MKKILMLATIGIMSFVHGQENPCPENMPLDSYFAKLQENNQQLLTSEFHINMASNYQKLAGRMLNPELEFFGVKGRDYSVTNLQMTETRFWFQFQLGDKIRKRKELASAETEHRQVRMELEKLLILKEAAMIWMRQNQVNDELGYREKALEEIIKVERYYSSKPHLSPDQEIEAGIIQLIRDEFQVRIARLSEEGDLNMQLLRSLIGNVCHLKDVADLKFPIPETEVVRAYSHQKDIKDSLGSKMSLLEVTMKEKFANVEHAKAMPDMKMGPLLQSYSAGSSPQFYTAGIMFVLPLPILDRNKGAREIAIHDVELKKRLYLQEIKSREDLLNTRLGQYQRQKELLKKSQSVKTLRNKLTKISSQFDRGRLSLSLIAEFQRQLNEMTTELHRQEIHVINEFFDIWELSGRDATQMIELIKREST